MRPSACCQGFYTVGVVGHANASDWVRESMGSGVQDHLQLYSESVVTLSYQ